MTEKKLDRAKVTVNLNVTLDKKDLSERAADCTKTIQELETLEDEYKEVKKEYGGRLKTLRKDVNRLARAHVTGKEPREVSCDQVWDLAGKETWYEYGGKMYEKRKMDEYEIAQVKQRSLMNDGPNIPGVDHEATREANAPTQEQMQEAGLRSV